MSEDWPDGVPEDDQAEAEAMSEVIAWTPDGQPRQGLPSHLPRPSTVIVTTQALHIDGWVILLRFEPRWMQWLVQSVAEWCEEPCDEASRQQILGIIEAVEMSFLRLPKIRRGNLRGSNES
jgi:hypothetical protein